MLVSQRALLLGRALLALLAGLSLFLAFPTHDVWLGAPLGVALLSLSVRGAPPRLAGLLGLLGGLSFFVPLLSWSGIEVGPVPWLLLSLLQASFLVPLGLLLRLSWRLPAPPLWAAAAWVLVEALRSRLPFGGFPWGRLAFSQLDSPLAPLAALGGAPLLSFGTALLGLLALSALLALPALRRTPLCPALFALGVLSLLLVPSLVPSPTSSGSATVALVQGNVPRLGLDFNAQRQAVLENHASATEALARDVSAGRAPAPDLVLWPENASDVDPFAVQEAGDRIDAAVRAVGVPVLVGALVSAPDPSGVHNVGVVWDPVSGPGERYVKRHPVPFGEYIPLRPLARLFSSDVDRVARDMLPGSVPGLLQVGPVLVGDVICFEVAYDSLVRDVVLGGGEVVVVQTNNATFGLSDQTHQQLAMARLRALEHGRTVLSVSTSGVSAVVAPDASVVAGAGVLTAATLVEEVPLVSSFTLATRLGVLPELVLSLLALVPVLLVRRRRTPTSTAL